MLPRAVAALDRGGFKEAQRVGHLAVGTGEEDAAEFLESVRAIRRGSKLVRRWPRDPQARLALAQAYFLADAGAAALREATEAVRLDPSLGEAHALLGLEYIYEGDRDRARATWEKARTLAPTGEWQQLLAGTPAARNVRRCPGGDAARQEPSEAGELACRRSYCRCEACGIVRERQ